MSDENHLPPSPGTAGQPGAYPGAPGPVVPGVTPPGSAVPVTGVPGGSKKKLWIILGAFAAAIVLMIAIIITSVVGRENAEKQAQADAEENAVGVATAFFDALSAGDAAAALDQLKDTTGLDKTFLTDEVLAASNALGEISDVSASLTDITDYESMSNTADVLVTYAIDGNKASTTFAVKIDTNGTAKILAGGTQTVSLPLSKLPVALNGVAASGDRAEVFYGNYEITSENPSFTYGEDATFAVTGDTHSIPDSIEPVMTDEAHAGVVAAVKQAVTTCLAEKTLASSCGLDVPATLSDGSTVDEGSVTRALADPSALDRLDITPTFGKLAASVSGFGAINYTVTGTSQGQSGTFEILFGRSLGIATVDMTTDEYKVSFR